MADGQQYCTFFVAGQYFGLEVLKVQEIIGYQPMTRVPLAPRMVCGLINLRGQIVTVIDMRRRLQMPTRPVDCVPVNVVVNVDGGAVTLLVDEIGDIVEVAEGAFERPPETLRASARELIRGAYKLKDRLLLILDPNKIVTPDAGETTSTALVSLKHPSPVAGLLEHSS